MRRIEGVLSFGRGKAYREKCDRNRAIADFRKALQFGDEGAREQLQKLGATP